jgi:triphosphatase
MLHQAQRHHDRVRTALANPRYTGLLLGLGAWIAGGWQQDGVTSDALTQKVGKAAPRLVQHAAARVRKRARDTDLTRPECLHKVRIAAKKERYAREFFAALASGKKAMRRHELLAGMQDELGLLNDGVAARALIAELRERVPQEAGLLGFIEGVLAARTAYELPAARRHVKRRLRERAGF